MLERLSYLSHRIASVLAFIALAGGLVLIWATGVTSARHLAANLLASYFLVWGLVALFSRAPRTEITVRFYLTTLTVGSVLLGLEGLAFTGLVDYRILFATPAPRDRPWLEPTRQFDPELHFIPRPFQRLTGIAPKGNTAVVWCLPPSTQGYPYDIRYDRNGFRNERELTQAEIAVVGDSFIEATEMPNDKILTSVLARLLDTTVINLGQGGYGPQQELVVLKRHALRMQPKVIIWAFYEGNDVVDAVYYDKRAAELSRGLPAGPSRLDRSLVKNSLDAILHLLTPACEPDPNARRRSGVFHSADGRRLQMYFEHCAHPLAAFASQGLRRTEEVLSAAYSLTRREGIDLVVAFLPDKFRVYKDVVDLPDDAECLDWPVKEELPQRLQRIVAGISPEIRYLDMTPIFIAEAKRGELLYLLDDNHWSADGERLAAEALSRLLSTHVR